MPSSYDLFLHRHDLHQKISLKIISALSKSFSPWLFSSSRLLCTDAKLPELVATSLWSSLKIVLRIVSAFSWSSLAWLYSPRWLYTNAKFLWLVASSAWSSPKNLFENHQCSLEKFFALTVFLQQAAVHWCQVARTCCYTSLWSSLKIVLRIVSAFLWSSLAWLYSPRRLYTNAKLL